jgi:hypothetical protein
MKMENLPERFLLTESILQGNAKGFGEHSVNEIGIAEGEMRGGEA